MRQRTIFWFWLPLFASWLLMTAEGPFVSTIINRLPDEVIMLAAQGIVVSLSVTIESPIIALLATSTAVVKDRASYLAGPPFHNPLGHISNYCRRMLCLHTPIRSYHR